MREGSSDRLRSLARLKTDTLFKMLNGAFCSRISAVRNDVVDSIADDRNPTDIRAAKYEHIVFVCYPIPVYLSAELAY